MESKYRFTDWPDKFVIEANGRNPVTVHYSPYRWDVQFITGEKDEPAHQAACGQVGLYNFRALLRQIAYGLMWHWRCPNEEADPPAWSGLRRWAVEQTMWAINRRVHQRWMRHVANVKPEVRDVQRAVFAATMNDSLIAMLNGDLYTRPYLVRDLTHLRGAAAAAAKFQELIWMGKVLEAFRAAPWDQLNAFQQGDRLDRWLSFTPFGEMDLASSAALDRLEDWPDLFSPTGQRYRTLNRMLANLPGGVPAGLLMNLTGWRFERPITNRLELITMLHFVGFYPRDSHGFSFTKSRYGTRLCFDPHHQDRVELLAARAKIFEYARAEQIREALHLVNEATGLTLSHRRGSDVEFLVQYLLDYPDNCRGSIVQLTKKAIGWHRQQVGALPLADAQWIDPVTHTAVPPIALPDQAGVTFLSTVEAVWQEGQGMNHCIASYAAAAVKGRSYLFHIDHLGEEASVAVSSSGQVIQARGSNNSENRAALWGQRVLAVWGSQFPHSTEIRNSNKNNGDADPVGYEIPF